MKRRKAWIVQVDVDPDDDLSKLEVRTVWLSEPRSAKEVETIFNRMLDAPALVWGVRPYDFH